MNPCSPDGSVGGLNTPELCCCTGTPGEMKDSVYWKKKKDVWKVADIMSACCKSTLTSGRHLNISFVRSLLQHVNMFVATYSRSSFFSCVPDFHSNKYSVYVSVTYPFTPASCLSVKYTAMMRSASKYRKISIYICMYLVNRWLHLLSAFCDWSTVPQGVVCICHVVCSSSPYWWWHTAASFCWFCPSQIINVAICYCSTTLERVWLKKQSTELQTTL